MANRYMIYAWNNGKSSKLLAEALGSKRIKHNRSNYRHRRGDLVINWGSGELPPNINKDRVLNTPAAINLVADKLQFFRRFKDTGLTPQYWENVNDAMAWLKQGRNRIVVARTVLRGHSGAGIQLVRDGDTPPAARLYTAYTPKTDEYRVHFFGGRSIFVQRKARARDVPDDKVNWRIRNHANGFIFAHQNLEVPAAVTRIAEQAIHRLPLFFGAIDIIYSDKTDTALVLEVNSAPGLEGTTLEKYKEAFLAELPRL